MNGDKLEQNLKRHLELNLKTKVKGSTVSTVRLPLCHRHFSDCSDLPDCLFYETMILSASNEWSDFQERHNSEETARKRHAEIVEQIEAGCDFFECYPQEAHQ